jgi:hypothetical protein
MGGLQAAHLIKKQLFKQIAKKAGHGSVILVRFFH